MKRKEDRDETRAERAESQDQRTFPGFESNGGGAVDAATVQGGSAGLPGCGWSGCGSCSHLRGGANHNGRVVSKKGSCSDIWTVI